MRGPVKSSGRHTELAPLGFFIPKRKLSTLSCLHGLCVVLPPPPHGIDPRANCLRFEVYAAPLQDPASPKSVESGESEVGCFGVAFGGWVVGLAGVGVAVGGLLGWFLRQGPYTQGFPDPTSIDEQKKAYCRSARARRSRGRKKV